MRTPMFGSFSSSFTNIGSSSSWFELYATFSTFMMLLRTAINDLIPLKLRNFIIIKLKSFFTNYQPNNQVSLQIDQFWDGSTNHLYYAAKEYLPTKISNTYKSLKVGKLSKHNNIVIAFDGKQTVVDEFENIKVKWNLVEKSNNDDGFDNPKKHNKSSKDYEENGFVLSFDEKHRDKVMEKYLPHVLSTYEAIKAGHKTLKIHSMQCGPWKQSDLNHPASFDSLALEPDLKNAIIDDLDRFLRRKKLYKKVGKPWKRGYLLYGPPGTGKSSLIAAIAKYLKFDVYDLDLSAVFSNSELMRAMRETSNRSIIVFEDIDCNSEVLDRSKSEKFANMDSDSDLIAKVTKSMPKRFTLSGLLNYMDGLWSSCGEERILIFTTNHKDKVDSALLRPGRMDMHIHLSFLKAKAFRILASNYLDIEEHHYPLLEQVDELLEKVEVTPAVVAEYLLRNEDPEVALKEIVKFLKELDIPKVIVDEECSQNV